MHGTTSGMFFFHSVRWETCLHVEGSFPSFLRITSQIFQRTRDSDKGKFECSKIVPLENMLKTPPEWEIVIYF
jgi:hypothetical protein